jgi:hypothetical protein
MRKTKNKQRLKSDDRIVLSVSDLLHEKVDKIKYNDGFSNSDITKARNTSAVYNKVLFRLMELMIMDVIEGDLVYFNRRSKARFSVHYWMTHKELIEGKGIHDNMETELVDLTKTNYRMPVIAFDPGYKNSKLCLTYIPKYLYGMLIDKVNEGKKYPQSNKRFWFENK